MREDGLVGHDISFTTTMVKSLRAAGSIPALRTHRSYICFCGLAHFCESIEETQLAVIRAQEQTQCGLPTTAVEFFGGK